MEHHSPASADSRRKRRRLSNGSVIRRESEAASSAGELGSMRKGLAKGSSSFVGSGSGIYFVRTVQAAFARNYSRRGSEAGDEDLVPGEDDRLQTASSAGSLWNMDEVNFRTSENAALKYSFDELVNWAQPYFDNWHPPFPFLLGSSVLALFEKVSLQGIESLNDVDAILVRSILSMSIADRRQMPKDETPPLPSKLVFATIDEAMSCLTPVMMQPSTLAGLQALVAIQSFLISMLHLNAASRIGGLIVRIAFHLGLHRCPSRYEQFSTAEADIRRRVFWTIYTLERFLSQSLGLPVDLRDDDIDVCYPDNELHGSVAQSLHLQDKSHDPRVLLLPSFLARHGKIRGLILELRHIAVKARTTDPEEVALVEAEISKWWNEAQDLLDPDFIDDENEAGTNRRDSNLLKQSHKLLLVVQKHESVILLNRPVITSGYNTSQFSAAMQKCIGASKQIVSKVYQHLHQNSAQNSLQEGISRSPLFWPGFTWCVWMSGLILLYAATEGHYSVQNAQREAARCIKILEVLSVRGSVWPGACATALRDLQKALAHKAASSKNVAKGNPSSMEDVVQTRSSALSQRPVHHEKNTGNAANGTHAPRLESSISPAVSSSYGYPGEHHQDVHQSNLASGEFSVLEQETPSQFGTGQGEFGQPVSDFGFANWQAVNMNFDPMPLGGDGSFDGFNNIFQLMDVSYQMSEQMFDPNNNTMPRF